MPAFHSIPAHLNCACMQANLAMKVNAKVGGVNTCWSVLGQELLRGYFSKAVSSLCWAMRVWLAVCCSSYQQTSCSVGVVVSVHPFSCQP